MTSIEKRRHVRIRHGANLLLTNNAGTSVTLKTHDLSDSGLLIKCASEAIVKEGEHATVKVLDIDDALSQKVKVIRIDPGVAIAVEFLGVS